MKRIAVLRANQLRHRALSANLVQAGFEVFELIQEKRSSHIFGSKIQQNHFQLRDESEREFFAKIVSINSSEAQKVETTEINQSKHIYQLLEFKPDYLVVFGTSILNSEWVRTFQNKILGIHLGLSPYYRGSGTNFFPFVNRELGAVGYTLMNLDEGIDTGSIIHQKRATFLKNDNIHSIGNRLISNMFDDIVNLIKFEMELAKAIPQPNRKGLLYRNSDFTEEALRTALDNLSNGLIDNYLRHPLLEDSKFPLISSTLLK